MKIEVFCFVISFWLQSISYMFFKHFMSAPLNSLVTFK